MSKRNGRVRGELTRANEFPYGDLRVALRMWAHVAYVEGGAYTALIAGAGRRPYRGREDDLRRWGRARELAFLWQRAWESLAACKKIDVEGLLALIDAVADGIEPPADVLATLKLSGPDPGLDEWPPIVQELEPADVTMGPGIVDASAAGQGVPCDEDERSASTERAPLPDPPSTDI